MNTMLRAELRKLARGKCQRLRITRNENREERVVFRNVNTPDLIRHVLLPLDHILAQQDCNYTRPFSYTTYDTDHRTVIENVTFRCW